MKNELTLRAVETETSRICAVTTLTRSRDGGARNGCASG